MEDKKLLVLGGKPIGSCEIVSYAKSQGIYTIVTDYLDKKDSKAKQIADEIWNISTSDVEELKKKILQNGIGAIYTGVHEFNIEKMIEISNSLELPCYCNFEQWRLLNNKSEFKKMCKKYDIPVAKEYSISSINDEEGLDKIEYPVIIKPVDGSGSRGFSICNSKIDIKKSYDNAKKNSLHGGVLIEKYMNYKNSVIINYTLHNGEIYYSGIGDKTSKKVFENGAPIMSSVVYPSLYEQEYLNHLDAKVKKMYKEFGLRNGVIWIEAFCDNGKFTFNEMGYRFGGSLTYLPVKYKYGINQLEMQIDYACNNIKDDKYYFDKTKEQNDEIYVVLPIHVRPGIIKEIKGIEEVKLDSRTKNIVFVHHINDEIEEWGSAQQVFAYVHFVVKNRNDISSYVKYLMETIFVLNEKKENLLFNLYE